jgi:aspartyl-tRNA(Asn)/glutamyl-tRNA(Gln) amidotransferase subunit A
MNVALPPTITSLAPRLAAREITAASLVEQCLKQIDRHDRQLNAFITVMADSARAAAAAADREIATGAWRGPLHGIPISIKDLIDIEGLATTAGSKVRAQHRATADAPVVTRLRNAGAIVVGKTNLHEFAFGTTSEDSAFGPVRNPHDPARSAGGSSGGAAAAIVTGMCHASVGTDTGGSVRIPAAACGVVGFKPTYDRIPCDGVVPLSTLLDHVGPLTLTVRDAWLMYQVMRGNPRPGSLLETPLAGRRLGVLHRYFVERLEDEVEPVFAAALDSLSRAGAELVDVDIPHADDIQPIYLHIVLPEAAVYHAATLEARPEDYTPNVRIRLEMGRYVLAEDYLRALRGREVLRAEVQRALAHVDALALPTLPIAAPLIGATTVTIGGTQEPLRNAMLRLTQPFNLTGNPAITIPCGQTTAGLPCGLQLVGGHTASATLFQLAAACEAQMSGVPGSALGGSG